MSTTPSKSYESEVVEYITVNNSVTSGGGSVNPVSQANLQDGIYTTDLTVGPTPGTNTVQISATAAYPIKWLRPDPDDMNGRAYLNEIEYKTDNNPSITPLTKTVYGIKGEIIDVVPAYIPLSPEGYVLEQAVINYRILPETYEVVNTYMNLYEGNLPSGSLAANGNINTGTAIIYQGAKFDPFKLYEAELALDIGAEDTVVSQKTPIEFTSIIIKKTDNEFTDVNLRWNDYYPVLGEKQIILQAIDRDGNLDTSANNIKITYLTAPFDTASLTPDPQYAAGVGTAIMINGIIIFKLNAQTMVPSDPSGNEITLIFYLEDASGDITQLITADYNVKTNVNTALKEVLDGEAVFTHCGACSADHQGQTTGKLATEQEFDYVQEILDQVIPRKRSITGYNLIDKDGYYGNESESALKIFKEQFNLETNTYTNFTISGETVEYDELDDTTDTFRKLMKDYGYRTDIDSSIYWLDKIVDKDTLAGEIQRTTDNIINGETGSADDTGLYELYENVVEPFIETMLLRADQHVSADTTFQSRNNTAETGISYCFGCKMDIVEFENNTSSRGAIQKSCSITV